MCKSNLDFKGILSIKKNGKYIYQYCTPKGEENNSKKFSGDVYIIYTEAIKR